MNDPRSAGPRALVLVRSACTHDARALRVGRTLERLGYDTLVLGVVSSDERSRTARLQGLSVLRLAPASPLARLRRRLGLRGWSAAGAAPPAVHASGDAPAPSRPRGPVAAALRLNRLLTTLDYYRRGAAFVRAMRPALVHCNDYNTMWIGVAARMLAGSAVIYDSHELWPDRNLRPERRAWLVACEALFVRVADRTITTSPGYARVMARRYRIPPPLTVRNASERDVVRSAPEPRAAGRTLVYVGGLTRHRGLEEAIAALARTSDLRMRLVGPGSAGYREELAALARRLGVAGRVEFVGAVPPDQVVGAIGAADAGLALIQPVCQSYRLSLPNKLFEYVAAGLPILGSDLPTIGDFIRTRGVGLVVPPRDIDAIAEGMERIVDPARNAAFGAAARSAAAELSWEDESETLTAAYTAAVASRGREP